IISSAESLIPFGLEAQRSPQIPPDGGVEFEEDTYRPSAPTPPPVLPGLYGPLVLSNASTKISLLSCTSLHEHSVQRNVVAARLPRHPPRLGSLTIGGPPPTHFDGAGPSGTLVTQCPATQPLPAPHLFVQLPQWSLSLSVSAHV